MPYGIFLTMVFDAGLRYSLPGLMKLATVALDINKEDLELDHDQDSISPISDSEYIIQALYAASLIGKEHKEELSETRKATPRHLRQACAILAKKWLKILQDAFPAFMPDIEDLSAKLPSTSLPGLSTTKTLAGLGSLDHQSNGKEHIPIDEAALSVLEVSSHNRQDHPEPHRCPNCLKHLATGNIWHSTCRRILEKGQSHVVSWEVRKPSLKKKT